MKKGCKLLPKISGLKEYSPGGTTSNESVRPGEHTKHAKKRKRQLYRKFKRPDINI
jgi:hypothetical protein